MCFGNTTTDTKTQTYQADPRVASAAGQNLADIQKLQAAGYTAYDGNRVADFSDLQNKGFDIAGSVAPSNPTAGESQGLIDNYATSGPGSVNASPIWSQMSPYMNKYVMQALAPQIEAQNQQFAGQNKQLDAAATSAGAFGDSRAGIEAANLTNQQNIGRTGLIGQAYTNAFNTAIGAGAQDVSNSLSAQGTNANLRETALNRELGGANALTNLSGANLGYAGTAAGLEEQMGGLQQQQEQAKLNVPYSDYLAAQQYPFLTSQAANAAINAGSNALKGTTTTTEQKPDNSGWALAGAVAPALFNGGSGGFGSSAAGQAASGIGSVASMALPLMLSDKRMKANIKRVGKLDDGTPVHSFHYKADPKKRTQIGLLAQNVEKKRPDAVHTSPAGIKYLDYEKALSKPKKHTYVNHDRRTSLDGAMGRAA